MLSKRIVVLAVMSVPSLAAQQFASIPSLSFVKPFAGANPLPQIVTVASTGANFYFTTTASTSSGGNWLSVSNTNGAVYCGGPNAACPTPWPLTVEVNASPSLAVGTYNGQIIFASGGNSITVQVTLTVAALTGPFFDNLPGQLSFFIKTGSSADPPAQSIQVRNGGPGVLSWNLTSSTADGGNWLTTTASSGNAPASFDVKVSRTAIPNGGLVAGTFTGRLQLQTAGGGSVSIPVSFVVGDNVFQQMNPLNFTELQAGANPLPQVVTMASTGAAIYANVAVYAATGGNWLSVSNTNGAVYCGGRNAACPTRWPLTVEVNASPTLAPGTYTGEIVFSNGPSAMTVPVSLTIEPASSAFFDNIAGEMSFFLKTGSSTPTAQTIQVRNGGAGSLDWTVATSTSDGASWLNTSVQNGSSPSLVTFSISTAALPNAGLVAGTFTGQILFRSATGNVSIPVVVTVGDNVLQQVNPISFTKPLAGADPLPQILTIPSTGAALYFNNTKYTATGGNWLSVSNTNGAVYCGGPNAACPTPWPLTVEVNAAVTLTAGVYSGEIVLASGGQSMTVPVTLTVGSPTAAFCDNLPGELTFSSQPGSAALNTRTIQIRNGGAGTLNWTASSSTADGANWIVLSAGGGTAPSDLTVSINQQLLPNQGLVPGTFAGQVVLSAPGNIQTIPVLVVVGDNVFVQVGPLTFAKQSGGSNPLSQTISVSSTGQTFNFNTADYNAKGGGWLATSNTNGAVYCGGRNAACPTPWSISAAVNANAALGSGSYLGQVVFASGGMTMLVPVTLGISAPGLTVTATGGTPQSANVNTAFANPLVATVTDGSGNPAGGVTVTFTAPASGASGTFAGGANTAVTNTSGQATSAVFTANGTPGSYNVVASISGSTANFVLTNTQGAPGTPGSPQPADGATNVGTSPTLGWTASNATSYDIYFGSSATPSLVNTTTQASYNPSGLAAGTKYYWRIVAKNANGSTSGPLWSFTAATGTTTTGLRFVPVAPCRIADTRNPDGPFGGPILQGGSARAFAVPSSTCNLPANAQAYSLNVTVVPSGVLGYLTIWPTGQTQPFVSTLNSFDGRIKANAALVPAGSGGSVSVFVTDTTHVILDVNGYFVPASGSSNLAFYPVTPCRIADTRNPNGAFGGPRMNPGETRTFVLPQSACSLPAAAQAYSLNFTVVPAGPLGYLTTWPAGQTQPFVSTLNSLNGVVVANAAIVPAGAAGGISVYVTDPTHVIVDVNGYFAPPGSAGALSFYTANPCRVSDTRNAPGTFGGPVMSAGQTRAYPVPGSACNIPGTAQAYSLNATVVPQATLGYLTLWPTGGTQPLVSTLNAFDGSVTANAAIVPAGASGPINAFVTDTTHLILDINGYFAP